jgi:membrane glycosyltransferase
MFRGAKRQIFDGPNSDYHAQDEPNAIAETLFRATDATVGVNWKNSLIAIQARGNRALQAQKVQRRARFHGEKTHRPRSDGHGNASRLGAVCRPIYLAELPKSVFIIKASLIIDVGEPSRESQLKMGLTPEIDPADKSQASLQSTVAVANANAVFSAGSLAGHREHQKQIAFGLLAAFTAAGLAFWLFLILADAGVNILDVLMTVVFLIYVPNLVIPFWSAAIGFALNQISNNALDRIYPAALRVKSDEPIVGRIAVVMTLHNEDPTRAFAHFKAIMTDLDRIKQGHAFDYHILSDSSLGDVIEREDSEFQSWCGDGANANRLFLRRRTCADGFKGGNLFDFCQKQSGRYEILVLLDADSLMSAAAIVHLVQIMQADQGVGLLQTLSSGLPTSSLFARVFQFGHRQGMRCYIVGAAWWQGEGCHYWGHNCAVRLRPYVDFCEMPLLPGKPPFGGAILCHDQIEAALMQRAGFAVRFLPEESGSYEGNPPALPEFLARHLRWCLGNLQNLMLVSLPGLTAISRFHLAYLALKFVGNAALVALVSLAAVMAVLWPIDNASTVASIEALYLVCVLLYFAPKAFGIADTMIHDRSAYGGSWRLLIGGLIDFMLTVLLAPIAMVAATRFMLTLPFKHKTTWDGQQRDGYLLSWAQAFANLWPTTLFGLAVLSLLMVEAPSAVIWFMPFLLGPILAAPFGVATSSPYIGSWAANRKLCATPEEFEPPAVIASVMPVVLGKPKDTKDGPATRSFK